MKAIKLASADQVIPISKARANLSELVDKVKENDFFLISRKYDPRAALVDIEFMDKLLSVYQKWQRDQDLAATERIWKKVPRYPAEEVERDIEDVVKQIRTSD